MPRDVFEYRGVDNLVYAEVLIDNKETIQFGAVKPLAPVAEIGRTTSTSNETHYYDNNPLIVINAAGADELTLTVSVPDLETYAEITGQFFDAATGSLIEQEPQPKYFAVGYKTKGTDGKYRYVWRYKGKFGVPDETSETESDSINTNNIELTFTGVATVHKFQKTGKPAKSMVCDERYGLVDFEGFFVDVRTPDSLSPSPSSNVISAPQFFPSAATFEGNSLMISLVSETSGADIYYTTDGSSPLITSGTRTKYTTPFEISASTLINAVALKSGVVAPSVVVAKRYVKAD